MSCLFVIRIKFAPPEYMSAILYSMYTVTDMLTISILVRLVTNMQQLILIDIVYVAATMYCSTLHTTACNDASFTYINISQYLT
jgi:hypothetical protein